MWLRAHLSTFALGSVVLLAINLLRGSGGIWADTAIGAWGTLVVAHGILLAIARLMTELLADEDDGEIRPASEMRWPKPPSSPSTWSIPHRRPAAERPATTTVTPSPPPTPTMDPGDAALAAADRPHSRGRQAPAPTSPPEPAPESPPVTAPPDEDERVSWKAATDAAWLAPRAEPEPRRLADDDEDDFTPLKFD